MSTPGGSHRQKEKTLVAGVRQVLGSQRAQIQEWKESLKKITDRKALVALEESGGGVTITKKVQQLESLHERELRSMNILESPEKRAERIISDIESQLVQMRTKEGEQENGGRNGSSKARPWQKEEVVFKSSELQLLEKVLGDIQGAAEEIALKIHAEPPCVSHGFVEDIEALIRQNVILKRETDRSALALLELQDEVTKLRDDAQKNAEGYEALTKRLHDVSAERNDLSEKLRHGLSVQEKDEYAKEIQTLVKTKKRIHT